MYGITPTIVLYAKDPVATRQFYETVGLAFVEEKHGEGPVHYACDFQGMVLEIYPLRVRVVVKPCDTVALVLFVSAFEKVLAGVKAMDLKPGKVGVYAGSEGLQAVSVRDPDGRLVRLLERDPTVTQ
ncbi:MAG: VOC family protein [Patescibacteria group bacterium]